MLYFSFVIFNKSTAMEQAVAFASVTQRARVRFPVGTSFLGEIFPRFFFTYKTNVRKLYAHKFPEYHLTVIIILAYSLSWSEWARQWCVSSFMFVLSRRWPRDRAVPCVKKCMYVIQSYFPLPTGRGSVRPDRPESRECIYKGEVKTREWNGIFKLILKTKI